VGYTGPSIGGALEADMGTPKALDTALVSVIDSCSIGCSFCFRPDRGGNVLQPDGFSLLMSRLSEIGVRNICITGGEPTEHPSISRLVILGYRYGMSVSMISAARPSYPVSLINGVAPLLSLLTLSVDSVGARVIGASARLFDNAVEIYKQLPAALPKTIHVVVYDVSEEEVACWNSFAEQHGVGSIAFSFLYMSDSLLHKKKIEPAVYRHTLVRDRRLLSSIFSLGRELERNFEALVESLERAGCREACVSQKLFVSASGLVRRCPYQADRKVDALGGRSALRQGVKELFSYPSFRQSACSPFCGP
jgi:MoaA/NifB/PqqE/SkfB family radical SAM enzyme